MHICTDYYTLLSQQQFDGVQLVFREALRRAYDVLKAADNSGIKFQDFLLFMEEYQPEKGKFNVI